MAEVTVVGGGVFGLGVAWACARRGARVRLVERRRVGAGASGGLVGALAPHVPERWDALKALQLQALEMAGGWWEGVAGAGGADPGYRRCGRVQPLADDAAVARAEARAEEAALRWGSAGSWRVVPAGAAPGLPVVSPTGMVVHDTLTARLHPRHACAALLAALRARGAEVLEGVAGPAAPDAEADGVVVWATGWEGLEAAGLGGGVKGQALRLALAAPDAPMLAAPGLFVVPHGDGTVAVGSTSEAEFADGAATDDQLEAVLEKAVALCPALAGAEVLERWAGVRPRAGRGQPMLGAWPGRPGHCIANGGFRIGFALAPLLSELLAAHLLEGAGGLPEAFRPEPEAFAAG